MEMELDEIIENWSPSPGGWKGDRSALMGQQRMAGCWLSTFMCFSAFVAQPAGPAVFAAHQLRHIGLTVFTLTGRKRPFPHD
jgi:hypothetical protein